MKILKSEKESGVIMKKSKFTPKEHDDIARRNQESADKQANANLIAAAPDLFHACKEALRRIKELDKYREVDSSASLGVIAKALAKAEGK